MCSSIPPYAFMNGDNFTLPWYRRTNERVDVILLNKLPLLFFLVPFSSSSISFTVLCGFWHSQPCH